MPDWDGKERRKMGEDLRDIAIEVRSDVKHLVSELSAHIKQDDKVQGEIKKDLQFHQKIVYGLIGVVAFVELVAKFYK